MQLQDLEQNWQEPLHEYSQFASIIKKLLVYRHQKHVQLEMTQDALEARRESLTELEKSEREARRLEEALGRGRVTSPSGLDSGSPRRSQSQSEYGSQSQSQYGASTLRPSASVGGHEGGRGSIGTDAGSDDSQPVEVEAPSPDSMNGRSVRDDDEPQLGSAYLPPHPGPSPIKRRAPGMGLLSALSYTLHGMMDADPETARRNGISKTRENISQVGRVYPHPPLSLAFTFHHGMWR